MKNDLCPVISSATQKMVVGPNLFERKYLHELENELKAFLKGKYFTSIEEIVLGIKGQGYSAIIPVKK